ncbi:hypothetical protein ACKWTF_013183 [Chironomus riparius]
MIFTKVFIVLFTIHHICCTPAVDKSPSSEEANGSSSQILHLNTPDEFVITKPLVSDKVYNEFLNFLYRHDSLKIQSKQKREIKGNGKTSRCQHRFQC